NGVSFVCVAFTRQDCKQHLSELVGSIKGIQFNKKGTSIEKGISLGYQLNSSGCFVYSNTKYKCSVEIPKEFIITEHIGEDPLVTFSIPEEYAQEHVAWEHNIVVENASDIPKEIK